eukprot:2557005-Prymnesium_polylepis.1
MPSNFDCDLAYTLGCTAAALIASGNTAYMATAHCLTSSPSEWRVCGAPLYSLLSAESRSGKPVAAIRPSRTAGATPEPAASKRLQTQPMPCGARLPHARTGVDLHSA